MNFQKNNNYEAVAFSLLTGIFTIFCLSFTGFIFKININPYYTIIGLITCFIVLYYRSNNKRDYFKSFFVILVSVLIFGCIAGFLMDYSYDGRMYHQNSVIFLAKGWNPVYTDIESFVKILKLPPLSGLIWSENYTKFTEIIASNILSLTGYVELGKIINYLSLIIVYNYSMYTLYNINIGLGGG